MLTSYHFVPANSLKFINKSRYLSSDYYIYDLEDAVLECELNTCIDNLSTVSLNTNTLVRFRIFDENSTLNEHFFDTLLKMGFRKYVIPKFKGVSQANLINNFLLCNKHNRDVSFTLLLEDPAGLLAIPDTLSSNLIQVDALGLGSHDYCNAMGMKHTDSNLYFARQLILNNAKAFNINAIDTVSINIEADEEFKEECLNAYNMGFEGKFVIHPQQLNLIKETMYYTDKEVQEAELVYDKIIDIIEQKTAVVRINGKVYEKPHINRIIKIINWSRTYGSK